MSVRECRSLPNEGATFMPSIVEVLLETAKADTDLLLKKDSRGGVLALPRQVDFLLRAPTAEKAQLVAPTSSTTIDTAMQAPQAIRTGTGLRCSSRCRSRSTCCAASLA
jgi:hypothetical protein